MGGLFRGVGTHKGGRTQEPVKGSYRDHLGGKTRNFRMKHRINADPKFLPSLDENNCDSTRIETRKQVVKTCKDIVCS